MADTGDTLKGLKFIGLRPLGTLGDVANFFAFKNPVYNFAMNFTAHVPEKLLVVPPDLWPGDTIRGRGIIQGSLHFAGQKVDPQNAGWNPDGVSDEFLGQLHSFDWLRDLRSVGGDKARRAARDAVSNWIENHNRWHQKFWRPDILGARLAAWISFHDFFCASADDDFKQAFYSSLIKQARHLHRALPGHLNGIPLLRALKGLAFTGLALEGGEERLEHAFTCLVNALEDEILPDGVHITRSPEATVEALKILIDLRAGLTAAKLEIPGEIQYAIDKLAPAVRFFRHADGGLSLFHGGNEGHANVFDAILTQSNARGKPMKSLSHSGFERLSQGRTTVIVDTGSAPEDKSLTQNSHASALSFEMSVGRDRMIVNCGSYPYSPSWRDALRSTAAHSTLVLDSRNSMQIDEEGLIKNPIDITVKRTENAGESVLDMTHDGYVERYGVTHRRCLQLDEAGERIKGQDILIGASAGLDFAVRLHLHPSVQISLIREGEEALIRTRSGLGYRLKVSNAALEIEESVYWGEFEGPRRSAQVVLKGVTGPGTTNVLWEIMREKM